MDDNEAEEKLRKSFAAITFNLEKAFRRENLLVVDNSAILSFSTFFRNLSRSLCDEYDEGMISWWGDNVPSNTRYCQETIEEFDKGIDVLCEMADGIESGFKKNGMGGREKIAKAVRFTKIARARHEFLTNHMVNFPLEGHLPDFLGIDYREPDLSNIFEAVSEVVKVDGVMVDKSKIYKRTIGKKDHASDLYDAIIMSKVIGASFNGPVDLLGRDTDYERMLQELARNFGHYSRRYGIGDVPLSRVTVLCQHRRGLSSYRCNGRKIDYPVELNLILLILFLRVFCSGGFKNKVIAGSKLNIFQIASNLIGISFFYL